MGDSPPGGEDMSKDKTEMLTYKYHVQTWGGLYNEEHKAVHGLEEGDYFFPTKDDMEAFMEERRVLGRKFEIPVVFSSHEGFHLDERVVGHRVCKYKGEYYHSSRDFGYGYGLHEAEYMMEYKWYPGLNDYPLGGDFDYSSRGFEIVSEWLTGSFIRTSDGIGESTPWGGTP